MIGKPALNRLDYPIDLLFRSHIHIGVPINVNLTIFGIGLRIVGIQWLQHVQAVGVEHWGVWGEGGAGGIADAEHWDDLRRVGVSILTIGQYLRPSASHAVMKRYYHPDEFGDLKQEALARGFVHVESGPLVRSSYHAHEQADAFDRAQR